MTQRFSGTERYVATEDLMMAVNAAVTLARPVLVRRLQEHPLCVSRDVLDHRPPVRYLQTDDVMTHPAPPQNRFFPWPHSTPTPDATG